MKSFKVTTVSSPGGKRTDTVDEETCSRILEELDLEELEFFQIRVRGKKE